MYTYLYLVSFVVSVFNMIFAIKKSTPRPNRNFHFIYIAYVVIIFGYLARITSISVSEAILASRICQLDGSILPVLTIWVLFDFCNIKVKEWIKVLAFSLATLVLFLSWTIGENNWFYKTIELVQTNNESLWVVSYGWGYFVYASFAVLCIFAMGVICWYCINNRNVVSYKYSIYFMLTELLVLTAFVLELTGVVVNSILPVAYMLCGIFIRIILDRVLKYDIAHNAYVMAQLDDENGYVAFDNNMKYLGSYNISNLDMFGLTGLSLDMVVPYNEEKVVEIFLSHLKDYKCGGSLVYYEDVFGIIYEITISQFLVGSKHVPSGYLFTIKDDTAHQKYVQILESNKTELEKIIEMQKLELETRDKNICQIQTIKGYHMVCLDDLNYICMESHRIAYHLVDETLTSGYCRSSFAEAVQNIFELEESFVMCGVSLAINFASVESIHNACVEFKSGEVINPPSTCFEQLEKKWRDYCKKKSEKDSDSKSEVLNVK